MANVEIKHVDIDESMICAIAKQAEAEAERERRAKVIHAKGECQAAQKLVDVAALLATQPLSMQLRYRQTLVEIAGEKNSAVELPIPINLIDPVQPVLNDVATAKGGPKRHYNGPRPVVWPQVLPRISI